MGQSLVKNYIHIVFSTKYRQPLISDEIDSELFMYIGAICKNLECQPLIVGGYVDHVHILCMLSKKIPLMKLVEEIKSHSSKWIKTTGAKLSKFYWQDGYGAFSVFPADVEKVRAYISNQKLHHQNKTFKSEYLEILKELNVEYDERYLWS